MGDCKVLEKCKPCCGKEKESTGLAQKLSPHRPTERVIERQIVELARRCEECESNEK